MTRVFSGIQPTGDMHLGNYIGAVRRWVDTQPEAGSPAAVRHDAIFCVVDLHALTMPYEPAEIARSTRRLATLLLAAGIDAERCLLFAQSHVRAHTELTWLLNCTATFGELRRMTQFKDKSTREGSGGQESLSVGFFDYPVLMASDILLYDTDEVPVGDDQRQHIELTRDIAVRFNNQFGPVFKIPKGTYSPIGTRVMDLQNPTRKMAKSEESPQGTIQVLDDAKAITKKIKSAVTDSDTEVRHDRDAKPGVSNLIEIHASATGQTIADVERQFGTGGYGTFKLAVAEAVVEFLRPLQERFEALSADPGEIDRQLARGADAAANIADPVLARVERGRFAAPDGATMIEQVIEKWHAHFRGQLPGGLDELLDDDVVFYSPIVFTPQQGKAITKLYLQAAGQTLPGEATSTTEPKAGDTSDGRFRYTKTVLTGDTAVLEFESSIEGKYVNGVDIIRCNDAGRIVEFRVMIRPLQAINLVHQQMAATLERMNAK